ncbi:glycoprotein integral membrane protein 1 precursor [Gallus gallus]|uniref:Glycoprotein integral membrane 1 n=1 Tax=Gallus gallus TaxID=9031 RepID=F1NAD1_CHICK|nr:glycoprotein integral membrane protein 1 precursor [Gallus gallus]|eukprot:NP_001186315.1 glycoprotein integral membrane protein 1 precursor [Gallus gallus]
MEAALGRRGRRLLPLLLPLIAALHLSPSAALPLGQETIRVNVMMLKSNGEFHKGQVVFNITYVNGQVYLNDFPMRSGVAHITCQTVILENGSLDDTVEQQRLGTVSVRIMVHEWPLASSSDLQLIVIQEEVTEIDGRQVQQEEVSEIDILVKDLRVLRHSNYTVPLKESMLYSIPRDNDVLFTLPNLSGKDIQDPLQTTSQYLIWQVETTVDEETLPGKLPETPLRIEPPSSYKVMCQWVEDLRKWLCRFWFKSLPIFFNVMEVVVVGVIGAALILKVLKVIFPSCEPKGILLLDQMSYVPVITISLPSDAPDRKNNLDEKTCT